MNSNKPKRDQGAYLEGQCMALGAILRAVILSMPDGEMVRRLCEEQLEHLKTAVLPSRAPEEWVDGIDCIGKEVLRAPNTPGVFD